MKATSLALMSACPHGFQTSTPGKQYTSFRARSLAEQTLCLSKLELSSLVAKHLVRKSGFQLTPVERSDKKNHVCSGASKNLLKDQKLQKLFRGVVTLYLESQDFLCAPGQILMLGRVQVATMLLLDFLTICRRIGLAANYLGS